MNIKGDKEKFHVMIIIINVKSFKTIGNADKVKQDCEMTRPVISILAWVISTLLSLLLLAITDMTKKR